MVQNTNPITHKIKDLNGEKIDGSFHEDELQKTSQEIFKIEQVFRRKKEQDYFSEVERLPEQF